MITLRHLIIPLALVYSMMRPGNLVAEQPIDAEVRLLPPVQAVELRQPESAEPLPPGFVSSESQPSLTLRELEAMALANNPSLSQSSAQIAAARGEWVQVGLAPNPIAGYQAAEIGDEGRAGQQGGFVGQEVVTGHKLRLSRAVAAQDINVAEQRLATQRYRVLNDVRISFYEVLIAQRRREITQELVSVGQRAVDTADVFLKRGEANRADLLQARVEASSARILLENSRNDFIAAWRRLGAVVGSPDLRPGPLSGDLDADLGEIGYEDAKARLLAESPELAAAQARLDRARAAVQRAFAERVPNVDLQASVQHDNATDDNIVGVQVGVPIPIWNRNQGGIRRAQAELAAAQSDIERVELDLQQRLAASYRQYANAKQQVEAYTREILPDAKSSLELVTSGYTQGEFGYLMLLTSQRTFFQTNLSYLESLRQLREARAMVEGLLLRDSLGGEGTAR